MPSITSPTPPTPRAANAVHSATAPHVARQYPSAGRLATAWQRCQTAWQAWRAHCELVRTRRALLNLSPEQLRDVGLSEEQALREAWRPIWDNQADTPEEAARHEVCSGHAQAQCSIWRPS